MPEQPEKEFYWESLFSKMQIDTHFPSINQRDYLLVGKLLDVIKVPLNAAKILELGCGGDDMTPELKQKFHYGIDRGIKGVRYPPINLACIARYYGVPASRLYGVDIVSQHPDDDFYTHVQANLAHCYYQSRIAALEGQQFKVIFCNMVQDIGDLTWENTTRGQLGLLSDLFRIVQNYMSENSVLARLDDINDYDCQVRAMEEMLVPLLTRDNSIIYKDSHSQIWYLRNLAELRFLTSP